MRKFASCVILLLIGCAAPLVRYTPVSGPDRGGLTKFQFAESIVKFDFGKTQAGIKNDDIIISSVPIPFGEKKYGISGTGLWRNWGVVTTVNASFRGDSDLIQQITVDIKDERQQTVQALGSIAGMIGGLLSNPAERAAVTLPKGISVTSLLEKLPSNCHGRQPGIKAERDGQVFCDDLALDGTADFTADISISKVPEDALPASIMQSMFYSTNFFYSACRQLTITLKPRKGLDRTAVSSAVAVADPLYLETLRLPAKGNITVAPSCGANSVSQDPGLPTAIDYLNALASQAKAVKQSLEGNSGVAAKK